MPLLSDLPDDILRLISIRLNGFDNCSLWMASDSILRLRLVNNVITDFDIEYTIPGRYLWPGNFLKKLSKLSRLSLVVDEEVYHIPIENVELYPIDTLKYLRLCCKNSDQILQQKASISSHDPTGPTPSSSNDYINLNDFYCNLEYLKTSGGFGEGDLTIDFLRFLPQKLKTLLIPENFFQLGKSNPVRDIHTYIQLLPSTLTKLEMNISFDDHDTFILDMSKLPPNLTSLTTNANIDEKSCPMIPKGMKEWYHSGIISNVEKVLSCLPTGLSSLSIRTDTKPIHQSLSHLENLKNIYLEATRHPNILNLMTKCPAKLEKFGCNDVDLTALPSHFFNDILTTIELLYVTGINRDIISYLPSSVTELTIFGVDTQSFPFFELLPPNLKALSTNFPILESLSTLPQSLTYLYFTSSRECDPSHFGSFPPNLESFYLQGDLPESFVGKLPQSLTFLGTTSRTAFHDEMVQLLPKGLKFLSLTTDSITDVGVAHLPPNLKQLYLSGNTNITNSSIRLLPRSLRNLNLPINENLTDDCIKDLPRKLIYLFLDRASGVTPQSRKDLPQYLIQLTLRNHPEWTSSEIGDLPPFLASFSLR